MHFNVMHLSIQCSEWGKVGRIDLVLNEMHAHRMGNLTFGLIKSPHNYLQATGIEGEIN